MCNVVLSDCSNMAGRKSLTNNISPPKQVKSDSLGISSKIHLKVDVEMGKLFIKKAKDGPEDKFYNHKKSKVVDLSVMGERLASLVDIKWLLPHY